ncbi:MAG: hypothetical protein WC866_05390 [Patescibacteria group bacterium]|jgi:hypothetical protein
MDKLFSQFARATEPNDRKLYLSSVLYSLFHLVVMWYVYVRGVHTAPYALVIVHMVFVGVLYALPKEIQRWHNGTTSSAPKAGHLLVLIWLLSFIAMCMIQLCSDGAYRLPEGMTEMTAFLIVALGLTHASKRKHELKHGPCPPPNGTDEKTPT